MTARRRGAALWPGLTLACLLAVLAFVLSFDALRIVALACGVQPALAWMFPLIVDGSTLAFTWATWAFRTRGMGTWYPWLMLVLFSVVSLIGNALHAHPVQVNNMLLPDWVPPLVMTMPPIALLATTHMIVMAAGRTFDALDETEVMAAGEPDGETSDPPNTGDDPVGDASEPSETVEKTGMHRTCDMKYETPASPASRRVRFRVQFVRHPFASMYLVSASVFGRSGYASIAAAPSSRLVSPLQPESCE